MDKGQNGTYVRRPLKAGFGRSGEDKMPRLLFYHFLMPVCLLFNLGNLGLEVIVSLHTGILHDLVNSESSTINSPELLGMTMF